MATATAILPSPSSPSASECYRSWTAYASLVEAAETTNYRSVWKILECSCCPEPHCWSQMPILPVPEHLRARIRWYDNVQQLPTVHSRCSTSKLTRPEIWKLQDHFVSHHQRIELILHCLKPSLDRIYAAVEPYADAIQDIPADTVEQVVEECRYAASGWYAAGQLVRGVAIMDRIQYLAYVPRLAGVSGGNSPLMMPLTARTGNMEGLLLQSMTTQELARAIQTRSPAGLLAEAFIDCLDSLSRCWFEHVVTATTSIGITCGTKGTPNTVLVDRVLRRLHSSRLLQALGSLREPIVGIGVEMHQLCNYQAYPLADHYLDVFCDPGPEFGTHNVGWLPKEYDRARAEFLEIRRSKRTAIWEHFYSETRPEFCRTLSDLLGIGSNTSKEAPVVGFGLGSSVTEVLSRLVASLQLLVASSGGGGGGGTNMNNKLSVLLADDEFVTMQRTAAILGQGGAMVERVPASELADRVIRRRNGHADDDSSEEKKEQAPSITMVRQLVFVSLVNSCTQRVQPIDWVMHVSSDVVVIIDITQAVGNIPLGPHGIDQLATRPNVFFVGSLIKHARCGENLGFMTYSCGPDRLVTDPASGWAAYCSGLRENKTTDWSSSSCAGSSSNHRLYYDDGLEWDGGTPSWVEAAYVATRILKSMPNVHAQHDYVKRIQALFLEKARHLLSSQQLAHVSESNTLAFPVSSPVAASTTLPFGLDYKIVNGTTTYLRIGFGIHNLEYHLMELVRVLEETGALKFEES